MSLLAYNYVTFIYDTGPPIISMNTNMISNITSTSFVVLLDEVDDADWFNVLWWEDGGSARENITTQTSITIRGLTPNTKYYVNITAGNICGSVVNNDILSVTTLMIGSPVPIVTMMTTATTMSNSLTMSSSTIITSSTGITFCTTTKPSGGKITLHLYTTHSVYGIVCVSKVTICVSANAVSIVHVHVACSVWLTELLVLQ